VTLPAPRGRSVFFYDVRRFELVDFNDDGDAVEYEATADTRLLFGHAEPIGEPVVAYGPFVMNTQEEIVQAVRDYRDGRFR